MGSSFQDEEEDGNKKEHGRVSSSLRDEEED